MCGLHDRMAASGLPVRDECFVAAVGLITARAVVDDHDANRRTVKTCREFEIGRHDGLIMRRSSGMRIGRSTI